MVCASGFAGLAYEVVWSRMLAVALGTEMAAVLGVVTGFFAGLALGAFALDGPIRRARSPRRAYAALEGAIGAWAVASIALLPAAGRGLQQWLGAAPPGWQMWAAGFAFPALVLLPATAAMGGTLVALERMAASVRQHGRVAAGVYGANTLGAVLGSLGCVFVLLPAFGVSGTLAALAAVNVLCAAGALALGPAADAPLPPAASRPAAGTALAPARLGVTLWATGLLGITAEVLVIRMAAQVLQDTIYTFAVLLAAYLLGAAAGSLAWQRSGVPPGPRALRGLLATAALACLGTAAVLAGMQPPDDGTPHGGIWAEAAVAGALFLLPSAAMGAVFGCLLQAVRTERGTLGWAVGVNSAGAAAAPLLASLVLIPAVGAWPALVGVAGGYLLLMPGGAGPALRWAAAPAAAAAAVLWLLRGPAPVRVPEGGALLQLLEGATATAAAVQDGGGARFLHVNGHLRMGGTSSARSDWRQAHLPLLLHPGPRRALFLGVGTGATLAAAAAVPGLDATGVELSPEVVALLPWFAEAGAPALPLIVVADARRFVAADTGAYDVIVADLFHPALDGTGALYTTEHFSAVRARLAPGGVFCQWLPLYQMDLPTLRAIVRSFLQAYPDGSAWLAHHSVQTPMLALLGGAEPSMEPSAVAARLARFAAPAARRTGLLGAMDVLGLHVGDARGLAAFAGPGPANTDDRPVVALDALRNVQALGASPAQRLLAVLDGIGRGAHGPRLDAYLRARDRFIAAGAAVPPAAAGRALIEAAAPGLLDAIRISPEFDPAYGPLLSMAQALAGTDRAAARRLLQDVSAAAPDRPEAARLLKALP